MEKIVMYGKGGIGKSTIASNLSAAYAKKGMKILHVGCDPKQDSTIRLTRKRITSVMELPEESFHEPNKADFITKGIFDIDCIEAGGPKPGVGCGGRGITKMFEILEMADVFSNDYDGALFDVLGDVVCGGFAAPLRKGFGEKIFIVISEEIMSLYAANKIISAINTYKDNGIYLGGLILNLRNNKSDLTHIKRFIKKTNTNVISVIPRSKKIVDAEKENKTVIEKYPDSKTSLKLFGLADRIKNLKREDCKEPRTLDDIEFNDIFRYDNTM